MKGLTRIYNAMIEYVFRDKILFRENKELWVVQRMTDCYGKENVRTDLTKKSEYQAKLQKGEWFNIDAAKLTNICTKLKKKIINFDGTSFDHTNINSSAIVSMIQYDLAKAIEGIRKTDEIYNEDGQWFISQFWKSKNEMVKRPLKYVKTYPKWKRVSDKNSYYEDVSRCSNISIENKTGHITISRLNDSIRFYVHRTLMDNCKIGQRKTITRDIDGRWWICITVQYDVEDVVYPITPETTVGIDLGLKSHAVCSNGKTLETHPEYIRLLNRKKKLARIVSRKFEDKKSKDSKSEVKSQRSKNLIKAQLELAKIEVKIRNSRRKVIEQYAHSIIADSSINTIVLENLSVSKMVKSNKDKSKKYRSKRIRSFNQSLSNSAMYATRMQFKNKCREYGVNMLIAKKEFPSTQLCECGEKTGPKGEFNLNVREWTCSKCGKINNRDLNASNNLMTLPFKNLGFVEGAEAGIQAIRDFGEIK